MKQICGRMTDIQITISKYLRASAGIANYPSDHTFRCFVGMIETGEATIEDFRAVGGKWLVDRITEHAKELTDARQ